MSETRRIAMWSGPRNLSTAMMRSFSSRADCFVSDEPFYAAYLKAAGVVHPMQEEVLASQPQDAGDVVRHIMGPVPGGKAVWYQKHMSHHMVAGFPLDWMDDVTNVFLLRAPERVLASYAQKREDVTLADIGFEGQAKLFDRVAQRTGKAPVVVDSDDVRRDPEGTLSALCAAVGLDWDPAMLRWARGAHAEDGVWGPHWYNAVYNSTGFSPPDAIGPLPDRLAQIADEARPFYERMKGFRLGA
ncbi:hypothetical protein [Devosia sp.]|uniref:sulfotransferase-like domain-containing protein n=1 Tax=Devosia sp. TaxID=1871048 RepID=UPI001AC96A5D|nr:hypothetical protein [Devosia sp.]MBN9332820.1 sulfotransferase [Devosia sp.]